MNLLEYSVDKELFSEVLTKEKINIVVVKLDS